MGNGGTDGFLIDLTPDNHVRFIGAGSLVITDAVLPADSFVKLTLSLARDGTIDVYLDGILAWTGAIAPRGINACAARNLQVGADQTGGSRILAAVDDITIWPRALTQEEIAAGT